MSIKTLDPSINELVYDFRRLDFFLGIISDRSVLSVLSDGRCLWFASSETVEPFPGRDKETVSFSWDKVALVDSNLFWADMDLFWDDVAIVDSNLLWADMDLDFEVLCAMEAFSVVLTTGWNEQGKTQVHTLQQIFNYFSQSWEKKSKCRGNYDWEDTSLCH